MNLPSQIRDQISELLDKKCPKRRRPFACSFDIRLSEKKAFVVDGNFFPAGWHRFPFPKKSEWAMHQRNVKSFFRWKGDESIAIVPEHHIQNEDYLHNLAWIHNFFECCGFRTFVMPITEDGSIPQKVSLDHILGPCHESPLTYFPYECQKHQLVVEGHRIDFALSQYDGSKSELRLSKSVDLPFYPPHFCSWQHRRKHQYFEAYHRFVSDVEKELGEDMSPYRFAFESFTVQKDLKLPTTPIEKAALAVTEHWDKVVTWVKRVTAHCGDSGYWILKSDHGTYGLGVEVLSADEPIQSWSVRKIKRFRHGRHNMPVLGLVLQEGIPSSLKIDGKVAERVDYYFLGEKFSHLFRLHGEKSALENLNRPGAEYALDAPTLSLEDKNRLDIASILAFGGACTEYEGILKEEDKRSLGRSHPT